MAREVGPPQAWGRGSESPGGSGRESCGLSAQGWTGRGAEGPASASLGVPESRAGPGGWERGGLA